MNPTDVINRQTAAYNARDLAGFTSLYADDCQIFRMPVTQPVIVGKAQLVAEYTRRFRSAGLRAEILNRIELGNKVLEHERVHGILPEPVEAVAVYEVADGLIRTVWFYFGGSESPLPPSPE